MKKVPNLLKTDRAMDTLYRAWIEQNLQRLATEYREKFDAPTDGRSVYSQKQFHDYCITQAVHGLRMIDPDLFRAILVDFLITTHYTLNRVTVDKEYWTNFFSKKNESK